MGEQFKNLADVFNVAKKDRNVLSKEIIWESGVGKSQFYRIIAGKETPSAETKQRIADALNINPKLFDQLHSAAKSETGKDNSTLPNNRMLGKKSLWPTLLVLAAVLLIGIFAFRMMSIPNSNISDQQQNIADPNDATLFIEDVTIPDGTSIPINTTYVKTWRVKNTGNVIWKDRYLKRVTAQSNLLCSSPNMVPIPETLPGETVDISVTFVTPHFPGSCRTDWKSADRKGNLHFPDMHGLFSIVTVTE